MSLSDIFLSLVYLIYRFYLIFTNHVYVSLRIENFTCNQKKLLNLESVE